MSDDRLKCVSLFAQTLNPTNQRSIEYFALVEIETGKRNLSFQHVLTLPHGRPGSQVRRNELSLEQQLIFDF